MNKTRLEAVERSILTADAVNLLNDLEREFGTQRRLLLESRAKRQAEFISGSVPGFLPETQSVREGSWTIAPVPHDLLDRRVEITGPVDRKMMINALNSGAKVFMADFEDATSPTWENVIAGQANLVDAYNRDLRLETGDKTYELDDEVATLLVRPRGWHLHEKHFLVDGEPMSAALFDFGLYLFHGGRAALTAGTGPYLYLPKLESHLEARLWNDVFVWAQDRLGVGQGTIKATVLIETIVGAFEMDEILFELRDHVAGLNAGRWDYIFSIIKKFRDDPSFVLPDRSQVTMTVPFMEAYTNLLVATCHRRGAHAIGGMSAFVPNRRDSAATETATAAVAADKAREATAGCDGTWVAHPDLVPVAMAEFDAILGDRPNQIDRQPSSSDVAGSELLDTTIEGGTVTLDGVKTNVEVGILYLASWLSGSGAVAINNLMEDVATAEISRSQLWHWVRHGIVTSEGVPVTEELVRSIAAQVVEDADRMGTAGVDQLNAARKLFEDVALDESFIEFLTLPAYEMID